MPGALPDSSSSLTSYRTKFKAMEKEQIEELRRMMNESEMNEKNMRLHKETTRRCRELAQKRKQAAVREERRREVILTRRRNEIRIVTEKFQRGNSAYSTPPPASEHNTRPSYVQRRSRRNQGMVHKYHYESTMKGVDLDEALQAVRGDLRPHSAFPLFGSSSLTRQNSAQSFASAPPDYSTAPQADTGGVVLDQGGGDAASYSQMRTESLKNLTNGRSLFEQKLQEQNLKHTPAVSPPSEAIAIGTVPNHLQTNREQISQPVAAYGGSQLYFESKNKSVSNLNASNTQQKDAHSVLNTSEMMSPMLKEANSVANAASIRNDEKISDSKNQQQGQGDSDVQGRIDSASPSLADSLNLSSRSNVGTSSVTNKLMQQDHTKPILGDNMPYGNAVGSVGTYHASRFQHGGLVKSPATIPSTYQYIQPSSSRTSERSSSDNEGRGTLKDDTADSQAMHAGYNGTNNAAFMPTSKEMEERNRIVGKPPIAPTSTTFETKNLSLFDGVNRSDKEKMNSNTKMPDKEDIRNNDLNNKASDTEPAVSTKLNLQEENKQNLSDISLQRENSSILGTPKSDDGSHASGNRVLGVRGWQNSSFFLHDGSTVRNPHAANVAVVSPSIKMMPESTTNKDKPSQIVAIGANAVSAINSDQSAKDGFRIDDSNLNQNKNSEVAQRQSAIVGYLFSSGRDAENNGVAGINRDPMNEMENVSKDLFNLNKTEGLKNINKEDIKEKTDSVENVNQGNSWENSAGNSNTQQMEENSALSAWQDIHMQESKLKQRPPDNLRPNRPYSGSKVSDPLTSAGISDDVFIDDSSSVSSVSHVDDSSSGGEQMIHRVGGSGGTHPLKSILKKRPASSSMLITGVLGGRGAAGPPPPFMRSVSASGPIRDSLDMNKNLIKNRTNEEDAITRKKSVRFAENLTTEDSQGGSSSGNIWSFQQPRPDNREPYLHPHPPTVPRTGRAAAGLNHNLFPQENFGGVNKENGVGSLAGSNKSTIKNVAGTSQLSANGKTGIQVDRTPTDDEINSLWQQVRDGLDHAPSLVNDVKKTTPTNQSNNSKSSPRLTINGLTQNVAQSGNNTNVNTKPESTNQQSRFTSRDQRPYSASHVDTTARNSMLQRVTMKPNTVGNTAVYSAAKFGGDYNQFGGYLSGKMVESGAAVALVDGGRGIGSNMVNGGRDFNSIMRDENGSVGNVAPNGQNFVNDIRPTSRVASVYGNNYMGSALPTHQKRITAEMLQKYGKNNQNSGATAQQNTLSTAAVNQYRQPMTGKYVSMQDSKVTDYQQQGRLTEYLKEHNGRNFSAGGGLSGGQQGIRVPSRPQSSSYMPINVGLKHLERDRPISAAVNNNVNTTESLAAFMTAETLTPESSVSESTVERAMRLAELRQQVLNKRTNQTRAAPGPTALSLEENKILESLDRLNSQLHLRENNMSRMETLTSTNPYSSNYTAGGFRGHQPLSNRLGGGARRDGSQQATPTHRIPGSDWSGNVTAPNSQRMGVDGNNDLKYTGISGPGTMWYPNSQYRGLR